nr:helix-turn-helix domain-containing protein [Streptomyces sp. ME02-8801-2C]
MGRPERPLDPAAGPVQRLACELRELRRGAGSPSYRTMAALAGFSSTTLSQAAAGERLPSLAVVLGFARACGGEPEEWEIRWKEAEAELERDPAGLPEDVPSPYRGLTRFEPSDRHLFFGRDRVVSEVEDLLVRHRFAVLFGPSGSGKSSLLRAGLIPRLQEMSAARHDPVKLRILTPGPTPATTYGHLFTPAEGEPESWVVVASSRRSSPSAVTRTSAPASSICCSPHATRPADSGYWSPYAPTSTPVAPSTGTWRTPCEMPRCCSGRWWPPSCGRRWSARPRRSAASSNGHSPPG